MLTEYAFENGRGFGLLEEDISDYRQILKEHITDFLRTSLSPSHYSTSQIISLMRQCRQDKYLLVQKILSLVEKEGVYPSYPSFTTSYNLYLEKHFVAPIEWATAFNKICTVSGTIKEPFETQLQLLSKPHLTIEEFDTLISEKSVLTFFTEDNLSKKAKKIDFSKLYSLRTTLLPILETAHSPDCTSIRIARACSQTIHSDLHKESLFLPDDILKEMTRALSTPSFLSKIRNRYRVAIIDEFQDTDDVQWHIFKTLFVDHPISALYLVGDPKQSIYSFRNADLYTYVKAQKAVPQKSHLDYQLPIRTFPYPKSQRTFF